MLLARRRFNCTRKEQEGSIRNNTTQKTLTEPDQPASTVDEAEQAKNVDADAT